MTDKETRALARFYAANVQLFQSLTALSRASGQAWSEQQKQTIATVIADAIHELDELQEVHGALPWVEQVRIVRNHWERRQHIIQDLLRSIPGNMALSEELAGIFRDWYGIVTEVEHIDEMSRITSPWVSYLSQFQQFWWAIPRRGTPPVDESSSDED